LPSLDTIYLLPPEEKKGIHYSQNKGEKNPSPVYFSLAKVGGGRRERCREKNLRKEKFGNQIKCRRWKGYLFCWGEVKGNGRPERDVVSLRYGERGHL